MIKQPGSIHVGTMDSIEKLDVMVRDAVVDLLLRLADDELIMGSRDTRWADAESADGETPSFAALARDELEHARAYYEMLHELGHPGADTLIRRRHAREFRCATLASTASGDWATELLRRFLYDVGEVVRLTAMSAGRLSPLAQLAARILDQERIHLSRGRAEVLRQAARDGGRCRAMQEALATTYPWGLALFEPTEANEVLAQVNICPKEDQLRCEWESAVAPVLAKAGLEVALGPPPAYGGRFGRHPASLASMVERLPH